MTPNQSGEANAPGTSPGEPSYHYEGRARTSNVLCGNGFRALVVQLDQELRIRDGEEHAFYATYNKIDTLAHVVVAFRDGLAVGCGALKKYSETVLEIKRMYVLPDYRGQGIAASILHELEEWGRELGFSESILETGKKQPEAIRLYQKSGYILIPNYGQYQGIENSVCMGKKLHTPAS